MHVEFWNRHDGVSAIEGGVEALLRVQGSSAVTNSLFWEIAFFSKP
jgi:hypothetical protein